MGFVSYIILKRWDMNSIKQVEKMIGNTPLIEIEYEFGKQRKRAYFKCEWYNLTGSIKDRVALQIIKDARKNGKLGKGGTIAEVSSGNMGIALCGVGGALGYKTIVFMPKTMSDERRALIKLYGGQLRLVDDFEEGFRECEALGQNKGVFLSRQFANRSNIVAYKKLCHEVEGKVDKISAVVAGVGTSGTLMGVGGYFKKKMDATVVAVEPSSSSLLSAGRSLGEHKIQGLSDDIIPDLYDQTVVDQIVGIADNDAIAMAQKLSSVLGLAVGISGGANFLGCVAYGKSKCLSVFPDDNKKYLSTDLNHTISTPLVDSIKLIKYKVL